MRLLGDGIWPVTTIITAMTDQEREFVPLAISSVISQNVKSEILLFLREDCSWAREIEARFSQSINIVLRPLTPLGELRNIGVKMATTEWVAFLDGDDEWLPRKLQAQIDYAQTTGAEVIGCDHVMINGDGVPFAYGLCKEYALPSSWLVKRELLLDEPFDTLIPNNSEDWIWFKAQTLAKKTARLPQVFLRYRVRFRSSSSWEPHKMRKERLRRVAEQIPLAREMMLRTTGAMRYIYKRQSYIDIAGGH